MSHSASSTTDRQGPPTLLDELTSREDVPGTGQLPKDLDDLVHSNDLHVYTRGKAAPRLRVQPAVAGDDLSAWRIPLGANVSRGLPGLALEQTTPAELQALVGSGDAAQEEALRPAWATLSCHPRPATPRPVRFLRRRNGRAVVPDFVIGNDDRQLFYLSTWPWFCAGRIHVWSLGAYLGSGAGALVGTNVVLAASHMVPWGSGPGNWKMKFTPGYYDGKSTLGAGVYSNVEKAKGYSDYDQGDDMAVLKLYTPLGKSLGYFGYKTYTDDWEGFPYWTLIGYPGAVGGGRRCGAPLPAVQYCHHRRRFRWRGRGAGAHRRRRSR